jgi:hypothetical protein
MKATGLLFGLALLPSVSFAASDVLLQAVSFAVTGSDANEVLVLHRQHCIFQVDSQTYYFNNIYTDRISFQNMKNGMGDVWTNIEIHGNKTVVELHSEGVKFKGTELDYAMKATNPNFFDQQHTYGYADYSLRVNTRESTRVVKAWQYIFANGCKGMKSPF